MPVPGGDTARTVHGCLIPFTGAGWLTAKLAAGTEPKFTPVTWQRLSPLMRTPVQVAPDEAGGRGDAGDH